MKLSAVFLLVQTNLWARPGRLVAIALALGVAGSVLLFALLSLQRVQGQAERLPGKLLSGDEVHLAALDPMYPILPNELLNALRKDPRVARLETQHRVKVFDLPGLEKGELDRDDFYRGPLSGWIPGKRVDLVAWGSDKPRGTLRDGRWPTAGPSDVIELVVPQNMMWSTKLGAYRRLESDAGAFPAKVVGILEVDSEIIWTPEAVRLTSWYTSLAGVEKLAGGLAPATDARLKLHDAGQRQAFLADWNPQLPKYPGRLEFWDSEILLEHAQDSSTIRSTRSFVTSMTILIGACVVCLAFAVQGNAVRERAAQYTLLRGLGSSRWTLVMLLLLEAVIYAGAGLLLSAGFLWLLGMGLPFLGIPKSFDFYSLAGTGGVLLMGLLLGSAWPAYAASIAPPAEASARWTDSERTTRQAYARAIVAGLVILLAVLLVWITPANATSRATMLSWVAMPSLVAGLVLITPMIIRGISWAFVRPIAWLTRIHRLILADQMAGDPARLTGSVLALSVGLGGFVWMLVWGASMLDAFVIDADVPRWMVSVFPHGLNQQETRQVLNQPEFHGMTPLILVDTRLGDRRSGPPQPLVPTLVLGIKPAEADKLLPLKFIEGERSDALQRLSDGPSCLISSWYAVSHGIHVGDTVPIAVPGRASGTGSLNRDYKVAAVIELRGWQMSTKQNKARLHGQAHEVMVVLDAQTVRKDFSTAYANYFLGDWNSNSSADSTKSEAIFYPGMSALEATRLGQDDRIALALAVERAVNLKKPIEYQTTDRQMVTINERSVQTDDLDRLRAILQGEWGGAVVRRLGWLPLVVLAVSLFSVTGSLVETLRSRARELGVLRSCGLTRWGLLRLAVAESLLLGLSAIPVAGLLGIGGAWLSLQIAQIVGFLQRFVGIQPRFIIPWSWMWPGLGLTVLVCLLASVWAGWRINRLSPAMLQQRTGHLR